MNASGDPRIAIVIGSTRPGRRAAIVARWVHDIAFERNDATIELVDLANHDLPLYDEEMPAMAGRYAQPHTQRWAQTIASYDAFVFVTPEYNHAPPAALKNALDFLFAEWNDKACGFVGYGGAGGVRAVEQLRLVAGELKLADVRSQVALTLMDDWEDYLAPMTFAPRDFQHQAVVSMLDDTVAWARALRAVRPLVPAGSH